MPSVQLEVIQRLDSWFEDRLRTMKCGDDTRAYVIGVLSKYKKSIDDMSEESIVLQYMEAQRCGAFERFQRIGDWVLFSTTIHPESIASNRDVALTFGRLSYHRCHRLVQGTWPVYEELADDLPRIAAAARCKLNL